MQLTFRDMERVFEVNEKTLYQWLNVRGMPAVKANDQYYFNSVEVLEWALKNRMALTPGALALSERLHHTEDVFTEALERGGVHFGLSGRTSAEVLSRVIELLPLPEHVARGPLTEMLLSREQNGTTGVGDGIAIPHVKHPVVLAGMEPVLGLFFLDDAVDFNALDGQAVHTLFVILTPSFKGHLSLLSRLAFCLQDDHLRSVLARPRDVNRQEILTAFQVAESKIARKI